MCDLCRADRRQAQTRARMQRLRDRRRALSPQAGSGDHGLSQGRRLLRLPSPGLQRPRGVGARSPHTGAHQTAEAPWLDGRRGVPC